MQLRSKVVFSQLWKFLLWLLSLIGLPELFRFLHQPPTMSRLEWHILMWAAPTVLGVLVLWGAVEQMIRYQLKKLTRGITWRYANTSEVDEVFRICRSFYTRDDHVINKESLRDFMEADDRSVKLFYKNGEPVGLYIIFAIRKDAVRKILDGSIITAQSLNKNCAVKRRGSPTGLYVTNICARGFGARGVALKAMQADIRERIQAHRSIRYVFARMANEDGGRLIRKYGFEKTHSEQANLQIWTLHLGIKLPDTEEES